MPGSHEFFQQSVDGRERARELKREMDSQNTTLSPFPWLVRDLIVKSRIRILEVGRAHDTRGSGITREEEAKVWHEANPYLVQSLYSGIIREAANAVSDGTFSLGLAVGVFNDNVTGTIIPPYRLTAEDAKPEPISQENLVRLRDMVAKDPSHAVVFDDLSLLSDKLLKFVDGIENLHPLLKRCAERWKPIANEFIYLTDEKGDASSEEGLIAKGFTKEQIEMFKKLAKKQGI